ncbi:MAG: gamma-glutamylcyclotransferase [Deltaproteobacteria bacterium]|nr:gamma-glutamylcyclotransferase [Deltaproteobacteria bacterium]
MDEERLGLWPDGGGFRLFVYGTLLRGESNHSLLGHARFVGETATQPGYRLVDVGGYPGMFTDGEEVVVGELFEVDGATLEAVDELEGHPDYYRRIRIPLADRSEAWAYLLPPSAATEYPAIEGGDWRTFRRKA